MINNAAVFSLFSATNEETLLVGSPLKFCDTFLDDLQLQKVVFQPEIHNITHPDSKGQPGTKYWC